MAIKPSDSATAGGPPATKVDLARIKAHLIRHEGSTTWMYLCPGGKVTIGVGHALPRLADAMELPFMAAGLLADAKQIEHDYNVIANMPPGRTAWSYRPYSPCRLPQQTVDEMLNADVAEFVEALNSMFAHFADMPANVQLGLLDMAFNLGIHGLARKFPKFVAAIKAGDWRTASIECHRHGISVERNGETARLFEEA